MTTESLTDVELVELAKFMILLNPRGFEYYKGKYPKKYAVIAHLLENR